MRSYKTEEIRNISLLGSSGAGKTTLAEAMLFESGVIKRRGDIASGNTVCDYFPVEKEYGYNLSQSLLVLSGQSANSILSIAPGVTILPEALYRLLILQIAVLW